MAGSLFICSRYPSNDPWPDDSSLQALAERLRPDLAPSVPPRIVRRPGVVSVVFASAEALPLEGPNVCLGQLCGRQPEWFQIGSPPPEGSFALFRVNDEAVELLTDAVGSRAIWFHRSEDRFLASSSQRALLFLLGELETDEQTIAWMIASGTLGPRAWDRRIRPLETDSVLRLDRKSWRIETRRRECVFETANRSEAEHHRALEEVIDGAFDEWRIDPSRWTLFLSGGKDSRLVMMELCRRGQRPRSVTCGTAEDLQDPESDLAVAGQLASRYGLAHESYTWSEAALRHEPFERVMDRHLAGTEGRVDHIWPLRVTPLYAGESRRGSAGFIRGDEGFGWLRAGSMTEARRVVGLSLFSGNASPDPAESLGLPSPELPEELRERPGETVSAYRDRLYHVFRLPFVLSALTQAWEPYLETFNPLLARRILDEVRRVPDELRDDAALFRRIVQERSGGLPFGQDRRWMSQALGLTRLWLVRRAFLEELKGDEAREVLPAPVLRLASAALRWPPPEPTRRFARFRYRVKGKLERLLGREAPRVDVLKLATRAFLVARMRRMLKEDAEAGRAIRRHGLATRTA